MLQNINLADIVLTAIKCTLIVEYRRTVLIEDLAHFHSVQSSETQRIRDRMDDRETYMNKKPTKTGSRAPSRDHLTSTYTELNIRKVERLTNTQTDGLDPTYSLLNFRQNELPIAKDEDPPIASRPDGLDPTYSLLNLRHNGLLVAKDEDPPIASGPGEMPVTAQAGPHKQETNENIGNRPDRKIWLLCLVTFVLFVAVVGLLIHVSQIRLSEITSDRNFQLLQEEYHELNRTQRQCRLQVIELNSTLESTIFENSHLNLSRRSCLKNFSALKSNLSDLKQMHKDLRHEFCELLPSIREQTCSKDWIRNECQCYFISSFESFYDWAKQLCSIADSMLLEINSDEEENFVNNRVRGQDGSYWIGACKAGEAASNVEYKVNAGQVECGICKSPWYRSCNNDEHRFICEKSASLCPDIPLKVRDVCQQPVELT
ncbi:uncharacterized protein [Hemitrygon akajei]|uniref:uncharacterized protein n=1 Tax=Hemitrygon akajei TaxID=2704970 RepID=UPI003BF99708